MNFGRDVGAWSMVSGFVCSEEGACAVGKVEFGSSIAAARTAVVPNVAAAIVFGPGGAKYGLAGLATGLHVVARFVGENAVLSVVASTEEELEAKADEDVRGIIKLPTLNSSSENLAHFTISAGTACGCRILLLRPALPLVLLATRWATATMPPANASWPSNSSSCGRRKALRRVDRSTP